MRHTIKIVAGLLFFAIQAAAQTPILKVFAASGGYSTGAGNSLSWTLGETYITMLQGGNYTLMQGFQQVAGTSISNGNGNGTTQTGIGQIIKPKVIATSGGYDTGAGKSLSWTFGETFIATLQSGNYMLTQGFQQPEILLITGSISGSPFCAGALVTVPFEANGFTNSGNVFTAQISDSMGNFSHPVDIGTLNGNVSGNILAAIPVNAASGTKYRIRVVSDNPVFTGTDNGSDITIVAQSAYYLDADADGYGDINNSVQNCSPPAGYVADSTDCNDNDAGIHPGATEICDGIDNDCNGLIDDGLPTTTYYHDIDHDGYGDINNSVQNCTQPVGYVLDNTDCDDNDATVYPGAPEICDGKDNDCNGIIDDVLPVTTYYRDADGDGYGDINNSVQNCSKPSGYVTDNTDCDDNDAAVFPEIKGKQVFTYTGTDQTFTVPAGVHQITVKLWGAGGAGGNYAFNDIGGGGGFATATLNVNPGEQYIIIVGGAGLTGAGPGAYGGGGPKNCGVGGRGGGRSAIRNVSNIELITAGAGGGGGGVAQANQTGGHGGGGQEGQPDAWLPYGGGAGTQTEGGTGGHRQPTDPNPNNGAGEPGGLFIGGRANCYDNGYNGSGGGGYYGGGSGTDYGDGAGGGGSSFIPAGGSTTSADNDVPGNTADPDYADNAGYGGAKATAGNAGRVVILWSTTLFYPDADNDGYGDINNSIQNCIQPPGYVTNNTDCDDNDATVHPGANEIFDGVDNNCDGQIDNDIDGDGFTTNEGDCDDNDATVYPGATEICDGKDNDCNGLIDDAIITTYYRDADGDGYGDNNNSVQNCTQPSGYVTDNTDCDDNDLTVYPGAPEICDGKDNDCNGLIDDGIITTYYRDADGDGYGDNNNSVQNCTQPSGYVTDNTDCDDNDLTVYPGVPEICDGKDNDCNGLIDDGVITTYYRDADGDGYGDNNNSVQNCTQPSGYVTDNTDCDDNDANVSSSPEICDGIDNNCNGIIDDGVTGTYYRDADGDGWGDRNNSVQSCSQPPGYITHEKDCNDNDATVYPGAPEICDGKDNNCDGRVDENITDVSYFPDADGDGHGWINGRPITRPCGTPPPAGHVLSHDDCNDNNATVHPGAAEICDGIDNNCNGQRDEGFDTDGDGYTGCTGDCNDNDATIHPGATELCDGKDNDCNGLIDDNLTLITFYVDADGDGYGSAGSSVQNCVPPAGYVANNTDCNDNDATVYPGAIEICDGKDNNCNGLIDDGVTYYRDADGDGYGDAARPRQACMQPSGYVFNNTDCNDNNAAIHPGAAEQCNSIDDNCNGAIDEGCPVIITVAPQPASLIEGNKGKSTMTFVVSLSAPALTSGQVSYQTVPVTAAADTDYVSKSGTLSFTAGQTSKTVDVKIIGDNNYELNETFNLVLSNPINIVISQGSAAGTIINDDAAAFAMQSYTNPKMAGVYPGQTLVVPNLLRRNEIWSIRGLPADNFILLTDEKGQSVFRSTNYNNNRAFGNLATGIYFYQILVRNNNKKQELYRGKLMIVP